MFAVVRINNKQYKVSPKAVITVDKVAGKAGDRVEYTEVLLLQDEKNTKIGKPLVKGVKVAAKILAQEQGEKIRVRRYKSKVRYRRAKGFRAKLTRLEIMGISLA